MTDYRLFGISKWLQVAGPYGRWREFLLLQITKTQLEQASDLNTHTHAWCTCSSAHDLDKAWVYTVLGSSASKTSPGLKLALSSQFCYFVCWCYSVLDSPLMTKRWWPTGPRLHPQDSKFKCKRNSLFLTALPEVPKPSLTMPISN